MTNLQTYQGQTYRPHQRRFEAERNRLASIAYRMLGSFSDTEDVLQDAWLRWQNVNLRQVESPAAYLTRTVTRLCIDRLRSERTRRLLYTGPWLPEPIDEDVSAALADPAVRHEQAESISIAFLMLLQQLMPLERAVFILAEAFDMAHARIAELLDITPAHSRQLLRRARLKMRENELPVQQSAEHEALLSQFMIAASAGDLEGLQALMSQDIVACSDGGGRASAALIPLIGPDKVATVLLHLLSRQPASMVLKRRYLNGQLTLVMMDGDQVHSSHTMVTKQGLIYRIYSMRNPDKLTRLSG